MNNTYNESDNGPFDLYVEHTKAKTFIHPITIGKITLIFIKKNINLIIANDKFKIKIELNNFNCANKLKNEHFFPFPPKW